MSALKQKSRGHKIGTCEACGKNVYSEQKFGVDVNWIVWHLNCDRPVKGEHGFRWTKSIAL